MGKLIFILLSALVIAVAVVISGVGPVLPCVSFLVITAWAFVEFFIGRLIIARTGTNGNGVGIGGVFFLYCIISIATAIVAPLLVALSGNVMLFTGIGCGVITLAQIWGIMTMRA